MRKIRFTKEQIIGVIAPAPSSGLKLLRRHA